MVEIVNSGTNRSLAVLECQPYKDERAPGAKVYLSKEVRRLRFHSQCQPQCAILQPEVYKVRRSKSCPDMKAQRKLKVESSPAVATQTSDLIPYEHLLLGLLEQRSYEQQTSKQSADSRLSPSSMLDRYIEACSRISSSSEHKKILRKKDDDGEDVVEEFASENQQLQMMQMQLLFERQRREVHAERNRRLLGKLRDSRALEEQNTALVRFE